MAVHAATNKVKTSKIITLFKKMITRYLIAIDGCFWQDVEEGVAHRVTGIKSITIRPYMKAGKLPFWSPKDKKYS